MRQLMCGGSLFSVLVGLEGRVIFPAFGQYIQLHPPWNYVVVFLAGYIAAGMTTAHLTGGGCMIGFRA